MLRDTLFSKPRSLVCPSQYRYDDKHEARPLIAPFQHWPYINDINSIAASLVNERGKWAVCMNVSYTKVLIDRCIKEQTLPTWALKWPSSINIHTVLPLSMVC